jgi:hypothetical protein
LLIIQDIVFPGLGWVAIAGPGKCKIRAWSVEGTGLFVREEPLMPFEHPSPDRKGIRAIAHGKDPRNKAWIKRGESMDQEENYYAKDRRREERESDKANTRHYRPRSKYYGKREEE